jgi:hypothetical protein
VIIKTRYSIVLFGLLTCASTSLVAFPGGDRMGAHERPMPPMATDVNGDGVIDRNDMDQMRLNDFSAADTDTDGQLTLTELQTLMANRHAEREAALFAQLNCQNSEDNIDFNEFVACATDYTALQAEQLFTLLAGSDDPESISAVELQGLHTPEGHTLIRFIQLDTDGDGLLTQDEFTIPPAPMHHP